jgi:DUF4097 and DUF4098 domain-containing protein YvlB
MPSILKRAVVFTAILFLSTGMVFASEQGTFDRTLKVTGAVDLDIGTGAGYINIKLGSGDAVVIHATVKVSDDSWTGGDAKARLQRILQNPPIEQNGNFIHVGRNDDPDLRRNVSISYDVTVPAETRATSSTGSGSQTVEGIAGPLRISTGSGSLRATNIGNEVRAHTGSGEITLDGVKGAVTAATGSGNISAKGVGGGFEARTGSGSVRLEQVASGNVNVSTGSGEVTLNNVKGSLRVGTGSGTIRAQGEMTGDWTVETASGGVIVDLPRNAGFELSARSASGSIEVEREITMQGTINRREVHGKVGNGGYMLQARTSSGSIRVR